MSNGKNLVEYNARDGQQITLSFETVRKYLVHGDSLKVTEQELVFFMAICKSKGLNPFKGDCYLIKYGSDPAAIITSIDYFRSRARQQPDCQGWKAGIIVMDKEGNIHDSFGILKPGETLLGGFFEAQPKGWTNIFRHEVNLSGYIKYTKDGRTTSFWLKEKQPTMIAKIAESQGLRHLWPDEFQKLYVDQEIGDSETEITVMQGDEKPVSMAELFPDINQNDLDEFIAANAKFHECSEEEIKQEAKTNPKEFLKAYQKWLAKKPKIELVSEENHEQEKTLLRTPEVEFKAVEKEFKEALEKYPDLQAELQEAIGGFPLNRLSNPKKLEYLNRLKAKLGD